MRVYTSSCMCMTAFELVSGRICTRVYVSVCACAFSAISLESGVRPEAGTQLPRHRRNRSRESCLRHGPAPGYSPRRPRVSFEHLLLRRQRDEHTQLLFSATTRLRAVRSWLCGRLSRRGVGSGPRELFSPATPGFNGKRDLPARLASPPSWTDSGAMFQCRDFPNRVQLLGGGLRLCGGYSLNSQRPVPYHTTPHHTNCGPKP